jgi:DNA (cytosine-5)-methyltransferase 1
MKKIKVGSDFSGVGAFDQALMRLNIPHETVFACDMDKFARQTYVHNYGQPAYYPENVYDREIPSQSLGIYMTSPPCQAFSLAGKRLGKDDERGILFFNSHEFIIKNKPRFFIFENVKGLLSDDNGNTFQEWINYLGGKSVNGNPVLFPIDEAAPYHIYWKVLNAKNYGIPQNRERVFIIGIRDDSDNVFTWPKEIPLTKRLRDVLEDNVDEKYFLSDKMVEGLLKLGTDFEGRFKPLTGLENNANSVTCKGGDRVSDNFIKVVGNTNPSGNGMNGNVFDDTGISPTLSTNKGEGIKIKSATSKGYETATENDSINFSVPNSETRRGRVGKGVAQTLDTACNQGVIQVVTFGRSEDEKKRRREHFRKTGKDSGTFKDKNLILKNQDYYDTILANPNPVKEGLLNIDYKIRRLTPRECFRLMDFPDSFTWPVSDSQAYKQAGNSICVGVLERIINKLKL